MGGHMQMHMGLQSGSLPAWGGGTRRLLPFRTTLHTLDAGLGGEGGHMGFPLRSCPPREVEEHKE